LEYAPFWLIAGLATERIVMGRLEQLRWYDPETVVTNGMASGMSSGTNKVK